MRSHLYRRIRPTGPRERLTVAHTASFAFDASWDPLLWMFAGHRLLVFDSETVRDPAELVKRIGSDRVDVLDTTPSHAYHLLSAGLLDGTHQPSIVVLGGEPLPAPLRNTLTGAGLLVHDLYGPTEHGRRVRLAFGPGHPGRGRGGERRRVAGPGQRAASGAGRHGRRAVPVRVRAGPPASGPAGPDRHPVRGDPSGLSGEKARPVKDVPDR